MKNFRTLVLATALMLIGTGAQAALIFVGSWHFADGPNWLPNGSQPILTGQDAAALLFGGNASDYAIPTVDSAVANVNNMAWYSVWGGGAQMFA